MSVLQPTDMAPALFAALEHKAFPALTSLDLDWKLTRPGQEGMLRMLPLTASCAFFGAAVPTLL